MLGVRAIGRGDGEGARRTKINRKSMEQCLVEKTGKCRVFARALYRDCSTQLARDGKFEHGGTRRFLARPSAASKFKTRISKSERNSKHEISKMEQEKTTWFASKLSGENAGRGEDNSYTVHIYTYLMWQSSVFFEPLREILAAKTLRRNRPAEAAQDPCSLLVPPDCGAIWAI